jgi:hypothetical protein
MARVRHCTPESCLLAAKGRLAAFFGEKERVTPIPTLERLACLMMSRGGAGPFLGRAPMLVNDFQQ